MSSTPDLDERVAQLTKELAEAKRELEKSARLKSEFLANMSHELRTPLSAVIGFSDLLLDDRAAMPRATVEYLENILRAGRQLLAVINSVLQLAEVEAGRVVVRPEALDAAVEIDHALALVAPEAARTGVTIVRGERRPEAVRADRQMLRQILLSLLSNAVKFSRRGARVFVEAAEEAGAVRISIRDEGIGMSEPVLRELFKPFFQADGSATRPYEGAGLGLAITRRLVEQQGGNIEVRSVVGEGSTFSFTLPKAQPGAQVRREEPAAPAQPPRLSGGSQPLVLVVEDDRINSRLLEAFLQQSGYAVATAWTGLEALGVARRRQPAAILLDLILGEGEDGLVVLGQLVRDPATRGIPVVVVSSLPEEQRSMALGASGFLIKPVQPASLLSLLRKLVPAT